MAERPVAFMDRAAKLAREGVEKGEGGPFGAVVVHKGKVVGEAHNRVLATNDPTAHAEILAIRAAAQKLGRFHLDGCEIYTTCEPCPMCLAAIHWAKLDRVHYAMTRHDAAAIGFADAALYAAMTAPQAPLRPGRGLDRGHSEPSAALAHAPLLHAPNAAAEAAFAAWQAKADRIQY